MTTSSEQSIPSAPRPGGEHWSELTAVLCEDSVLALDRWMDEDLRRLVTELDRFVSPNSLKKNLQRSR